ncbi:DUF3772 domain-containing protein [Falsigemmobacter faecalis]|uniref:DUF3772 domain-containing protein n=1 Tax=Falsigemmobacter faecalis TaxID=2488730 RepID=A0A3P3DT49_9RHOB|nr:DUF3772 domain-containing protein [Falsigemmobacter faecalis]RRH77379.1 DUF3772 domain-containing protein [Falsigemmobacter faecalis]
MTVLLRSCLVLLFLTMAGALSPGLHAQAPAAPGTASEAAAPPAPVVDEQTAAWLAFATRTEELIADPTTRSERLENLRSELATWRQTFLEAQTGNALRITTLREQIAALGEAPAEPAAEPAEIAARRAELDEQLSRAQAPGIAAEEAYRRADGLIREADTILRQRQASELVARGPAPANPASWAPAAGVFGKWVTDLWAETERSWANPARRKAVMNAAPVLAIELLIAIAMMWQGRRLIQRGISRLQARVRPVWWGVIELPLSLAQVALPVIAVAVLISAFQRTGFGGMQIRAIADAAVPATFVFALTTWIAGHIFPAREHLATILPLAPERRREGRILVTLFALAGAAETLFSAALSPERYGDYAQLLLYPFTLLSGLLLFRIGQLLRLALTEAPDSQEVSGFSATVVNLLSRAAMVIGIAGPLAGAAGFMTLAQSTVRPAMVTLGVLALVTLTQRLIYDLYALVTRADAKLARDALFPVLVSSLLVIAAVPLLALVWGLRPAELTEYWSTFQDGFKLGDARISPMDFIFFVIIFGLGYGVTRLMQGALKTSILPKTSLDTGSKNAIVSGLGYVGIVLAALAAITSTGLDLSSLAIVAGALSVGIGFGLQNIVQNFISGVILLIERPVAEGDWVEVGGVQGIVRGISIRSTRVETFDRNSVIVPNASLISGQVTNFTAFNKTGRVIVPISVSYDSDSRKVQKILQEIAEAQPMVVLTPPPSVLFLGFGADGLNFEIRAILRDVNFSSSVRTEINHQIHARLQAEGVAIPFAQRNAHLPLPRILPEPPAPPAGAAPAPFTR